jgi:hypothetical protein
MSTTEHDRPVPADTNHQETNDPTTDHYDQ